MPKGVSDHLAPRVPAVVIDERGALSEPDWAGPKVRPTFAGHREVAVAVGLMWDAVADCVLVHRGQVELSRGALSARNVRCSVVRRSAGTAKPPARRHSSPYRPRRGVSTATVPPARGEAAASGEP